MERLGQVNVYGCKRHGAQMTTMNLADGVTPMFAGKCSRSGCGKLLQSAMYCMQLNSITRQPVLITVTHGWYRPKQDNEALSGYSVKEHVLHGGLLLAELRDAINYCIVADPLQAGMSSSEILKALHACYKHAPLRRECEL